MKSTRLQRFMTATEDTFTSDIGLKIRKSINFIWRRILILGIKRKVYIEKYPKLEKKKKYIFVCNHSFDEDVISLIHTIDRNVYVLNGSTNQTEHNPIFYALWANGMIYVNRQDTQSRKDSLLKMKRVLQAGNSVMLFSEGGYNNTENQLIMPLFPGVYQLAVDTNTEIVPLITFNDIGSNEIYLRADPPIDISKYEKYEGMEKLRDIMSTIVYELMEAHTQPVSRGDLGTNPRMDYMEVRRQVYECQEWYNDVWEEELTMYSGHGVTTPQQARMYVDKIQINIQNAGVLADVLARREEDKRYDLEKYLRNNIKLC
ncbi:MAG: 1-acyl-sn-glycerol-3-phosphate acyltransferase [Lachnospiraceae bacterium]|nr:1-acyl-sn-glycerol-3-phosphate acyltransferase [Lachnospiraceae bacterium]